MNNGGNGIENRGVNARALLARVFDKWPAVVVLTLLIACAVAAMGIRSSRNKALYGEPKSATEENKDGSGLTQEELDLKIEKANKEVDEAKDALAERQAFAEEWPQYQIDPYAEGYAKAELFIKSEVPNADEQTEAEEGETVGSVREGQLLRAYWSILNNPEYLQELGNEFGYSIPQMKSLMSASANYDNFFFTVSATYFHKEGAEKILNVILARAEEAKAQITEELGPHSVEVFNRYATTQLDQGLLDKQKDLRDEITELKQAVEKKQSAVDKLKKTEPEEPEEQTREYGKRDLLKDAVKYGILGLFAGLLGSILFLSLYVLNQRRLISEEELPGLVQAENAGKVRVKKDGGLESDFPAIATLLAMKMGEDKKLLLAGNTDKGVLSTLAERLKETLNQRGIEVGVQAPLGKSSESFESLEKADAVALVERVGVSKLADIEESVEAAKAWEKPIVGCIALKG